MATKHNHTKHYSVDSCGEILFKGTLLQDLTLVIRLTVVTVVAVVVEEDFELIP